MLLQAIFLKMATFWLQRTIFAFFRWVFKLFEVEYYSTLRSNNPRDQEGLLALDLSHVGPILPTIARWGIEADWGGHSIILRSTATFFRSK